VSPPRDSVDHKAAVESFLVGPDLQITSMSIAEATPRCAPDGIISDGETATLTLTVKNVGNAPLTGATTAIVTSPSTGVTFQNGGILTLPPIDLLASATVTTPVSVSGLSGITRLDFEVVVTDPALVLPALTHKHSVRANFASEKNALASDDVEAPETAWKLAHDPGLKKASWARTAQDVERHFWRGASQPEPADLYLISPVLNVATGADFSFTFKHRYRFEWQDKDARNPIEQYYDGGVIELSTDGITWIDIGESATPTYNATIVSEGKSPIVGRKAYSADSANYPAWETVTVSLGQQYAGQNVLVRFRSTSDDASRLIGWDIDDVSFTGITNTPFTKIVTAPATCP
jgi:large repetitive protein